MKYVNNNAIILIVLAQYIISHCAKLELKLDALCCRQKGANVLVHCKMGVSRSASTVSTFYLYKTNIWPPSCSTLFKSPTFLVLHFQMIPTFSSFLILKTLYKLCNF